MIRKVWRNNFSGQNLITIPNDNDEAIIDGDYVEVHKVKPPMKKATCEKCGKPFIKHTVEELYDHKLIG